MRPWSPRPPETHVELAVELLGRGVPVLVEKPMALEVADVEAILDGIREPSVCQ